MRSKNFLLTVAEFEWVHGHDLVVELEYAFQLFLESLYLVLLELRVGLDVVDELDDQLVILGHAMEVAHEVGHEEVPVVHEDALDVLVQVERVDLKLHKVSHLRLLFQLGLQVSGIILGLRLARGRVNRDVVLQLFCFIFRIN